MTNEEKQLLFRDLCERLPYGVKVTFKSYSGREDTTLNSQHLCSTYSIEYLGMRPYLRPMSSMTGEEIVEIEAMNNHSIQHIDTVGVRFKSFYDTTYCEMYDLFDYLNKHHFDYRGLIPMGLALEATEEMYKTKND